MFVVCMCVCVCGIEIDVVTRNLHWFCYDCWCCVVNISHSLLPYCAGITSGSRSSSTVVVSDVPPPPPPPLPPPPPPPLFVSLLRFASLYCHRGLVFWFFYIVMVGGEGAKRSTVCVFIECLAMCARLINRDMLGDAAKQRDYVPWLPRRCTGGCSTVWSDPAIRWPWTDV